MQSKELVCPGGVLCSEGECELLHLDADEQLLHQQQQPSGPCQLIVAAGPERSGSTWLFNAIRLLHKHAQIPLDSYWIHHLNDDKLTARGVGSSKHHTVLVKTHHWSDDWSLQRANHIFTTHRDLRQVLASYRRMHWAHTLPDQYVQEHEKWQVCQGH
eukprot:jgi/Chrzof1/5806/Cz16g16160.t1